VIRHKLDSGDTSITGDFDLNLDIVNLRIPKGAGAAPTRPTVAVVMDDEEDGSPPAA
jgi:hypothetical protein